MTGWQDTHRSRVYLACSTAHGQLATVLGAFRDSESIHVTGSRHHALADLSASPEGLILAVCPAGDTRTALFMRLGAPKGHGPYVGISARRIPFVDRFLGDVVRWRSTFTCRDLKVRHLRPIKIEENPWASHLMVFW
jgi:hypothetical protein